MGGRPWGVGSAACGLASRKTSRLCSGSVLRMIRSAFAGDTPAPARILKFAVELDGELVRSRAGAGALGSVRCASAQSPTTSCVQCHRTAYGLAPCTSDIAERRNALDPRFCRSANGGDAGRLALFHRARSGSGRGLCRPAHSARPADAGRQGKRLRRIHRSSARRALRPQRSLLYDGAIPDGNEAAGPAVVGNDCSAISQGACRTRRRLPQ